MKTTTVHALSAAAREIVERLRPRLADLAAAEADRTTVAAGMEKLEQQLVAARNQHAALTAAGAEDDAASLAGMLVAGGDTDDALAALQNGASRRVVAQQIDLFEQAVKMAREKLWRANDRCAVRAAQVDDLRGQLLRQLAREAVLACSPADIVSSPLFLADLRPVQAVVSLGLGVDAQLADLRQQLLAAAGVSDLYR